MNKYSSEYWLWAEVSQSQSQRSSLLVKSKELCSNTGTQEPPDPCGLLGGTPGGEGFYGGRSEAVMQVRLLDTPM